MQNLKRVLSLVLVVAMVMSFMLSASAATAEQLVDLNESNFQPEVRVLAALDIVEGYEDGTYKPAKDVTRAELATILARVKVGGDKEMIDTYNYGHMTYTDVLTTGHVWAAPAIQYATDNGMVVGDGNGLYRPADTVTVVEGLKMLLTALGYDAEIEGLQNVGAAWKANVLSLAREVGLLNRYYGDTNKNMTRDDMALLIWNFLNSDVVKGYYENDVANVDTIMYVGGTALEIYFEKQVVYGAILANEKASVLAETQGEVLKTGYTTLFLYDNNEDVTMADVVDGKLNYSGKYFLTVKLSTDLADIGEPVFIITDLVPTKGTYVAIGNECFSTGTNTIGVQTWDAVNSLIPLVAADETVYTEDYAQVTTTAYGLPNTNGDFLKTVDWDGDGILDIVIHENWAMTMVLNTTKKGVINNIDGIGMTTLNTVGEFAPYSVVNYMLADGTYYVVPAERLSGLALAAGLDAVNFKNGYVTLSDGNQYKQSNVDLGALAHMYLTDIMDCANDPFAMTNYTWFLDNGGYIRIYGADATVYDGLYLLTEATSVKSGRDTWNKAVDTYKQSEDMVNYVAIDIFNQFVMSRELPYGEALNGAINGEAQTNLAAGIAADPTLNVSNATNLFNVDAVIELQGKVNDYTYTTTDDFGKYGDYNVNNGGAESEIVYTTTETDYYYVTLTTDRTGTVYVKDVQYFKGYNNMPTYDFGNRSIAYAAAAVETDVNGAEYYLANTVVIETFENTTNVLAPYFAYEHVSGSKDSKTGIYNAIAPTGENTTYTINGLTASYVDPVLGALGFYSFDANTGIATQIVENWAAYGISAHTVAIQETGLIDYYVLDNVGGQRIKVTAETPVYAVMNETVNNNVGAPYKFWSVTDWSENLAEGDKIVIVKNFMGAIEYILVFEGTEDLFWGQVWAYTQDQIAMELFDAIAAGEPLYGPEAVVAAFEAAVEAYINGGSYDAMLSAYEAMVEAVEVVETTDYTEAFEQYYAAETQAKADTLAAAVAASIDGDNVVLDAYLPGGSVAEAYDALSETELAYLVANDATAAEAIDTYVEVADAYVGAALALIAAADEIGTGANDLENALINEAAIAELASFNALLDGTNLVPAAGGTIEAAIQAIEGITSET